MFRSGKCTVDCGLVAKMEGLETANDNGKVVGLHMRPAGTRPGGVRGVEWVSRVA